MAFIVFARLLGGQTKTLRFDSPLVPALAVKQRIFDITKLPVSEQRLICSGRQLDDCALIPSSESTVHLCLRLRGGKGGFGSLLRGAATKAGQKKTNNFDACRDMSGRRLRHVNAEKKLEEWKAEEEDRKLEKMAADYIKKAAKTGKKGVGDGEAHKYVEKYRQQSAKCVAQVELSVREASASLRRTVKRKAGGDDCSGLDQKKKLKIWMGKRKLADRDNGDTDEDSSDGHDEDNDKSVVLDNVLSSGSAKDGEDSSDLSFGGRIVGGSTAGSSESGSEEERPTIAHDISVSGIGGCSARNSLPNVQNDMAEPLHRQDKEDRAASFPPSEEGIVICGNESNQDKKVVLNEFKDGIDDVAVTQATGDLSISVEPGDTAVDAHHEANGVVRTKVAGGNKTASLEADGGEKKPLNFDEYDSAAELEILGMERLKNELQLLGMKCGGTLQERASRLFLLKSTPLDKIPKKLLAKK